MTAPHEHRRLRELLGAFALDALPAPEAAGLRAHLDGCAECRAELAEIAPLAEALRGVDPDALSTLPVPPPDLGERIRRQIAAEGGMARARARRDQRVDKARRRTQRLLGVAAVVLVLAGAVAGGTLVGRSTAPVPVAAPTSTPSATPSASSAPIPLEQVPVVSAAGVQVSTASVIAHTWGVEARFDGSGFVDGQVYRAAFRSVDGSLLPAGEFLGTGTATLTCNMQSALLRSAATGFVVMDEDGRVVVSAELPA